MGQILHDCFQIEVMPTQTSQQQMYVHKFDFAVQE